ncbi:c-type cytochrome [Nannocystaceae bacterium ST9]
MSRWSPALVAVPLVLVLGLVAQAEQVSGPARAGLRVRFEAATTASVQPGQHGGTLVADAEGLWVAERVSGVLVRADLDGRVIASLSLHPGLGELIHDPAHALLFVADRAADRVLRIGGAKPGEITIAGELAIREPHGLALTPDGATLLVTSVADHRLVAIDTASLEVRWQVELLPEPRGVAVSPDGTRAIVGFLSSGALAEIDLASAGKSLRWHALDPRDQVEVERAEDAWEEEIFVMTLEEPHSRFEVPNDIGRRHARNSFAVGFLGDVAIAAHQVATPQIERRPQVGRSDSYGGGAQDVPPITYALAHVQPAEVGSNPAFSLAIGVDQPRALHWDAGRDMLYVGGYGDDLVQAFATGSNTASFEWSVALDEGCGVDGLASAPDGKGLWVHCELTRSLIRVGFVDQAQTKLAKSRDWLRSPELAASPRSPEAERGAELFRRNGDTRISGGGVLACANCHPEGRSDGLSWRLGKSILQTPLLAGRVIDTAPYKWDGQDADLRASIRHTIERLGGVPGEIRRSELAAIEAYLLSLTPPRAPSVGDEAGRARGQAVFEQECSGCHAGERGTDQNQHELATSLGKVDTPSLIGLAHTAPYYHDGSATDLRTLLDDRATIHDMTDTSGLSPAQRQDLVTYLESL